MIAAWTNPRYPGDYVRISHLKRGEERADAVKTLDEFVAIVQNLRTE